ncbi:MAG: hypothetical protein V1910_01115 [bacterium]
MRKKLFQVIDKDLFLKTFGFKSAQEFEKCFIKWLNVINKTQIGLDQLEIIRL